MSDIYEKNIGPDKDDETISYKVGRFIGNNILLITFIGGVVVGGQLMKRKIEKQQRRDTKELIDALKGLNSINKF